MNCPNCGSPVEAPAGFAEKGLHIKGKKIHEGSKLFRVIERLAKMSEPELHRAAAAIELFCMPEAGGSGLARLNERLDRLEQKLGHAAQPEAEVGPEPDVVVEKKKPSRKRGPRKAVTPTGKSISEELLAEESIKERHARMAKMEKQDLFKTQALKKSKAKKMTAEPTAPEEEAPAAAAGEHAEAAPKKRPRRRRRRSKAQVTIPTDATLPA